METHVLVIIFLSFFEWLRTMHREYSFFFEWLWYSEVSFLDAEQKRTKEPRREPFSHWAFCFSFTHKARIWRRKIGHGGRPSLSAVSKKSDIPAQINAWRGGHGPWGQYDGLSKKRTRAWFWEKVWCIFWRNCGHLFLVRHSELPIFCNDFICFVPVWRLFLLLYKELYKAHGDQYKCKLPAS